MDKKHGRHEINLFPQVPESLEKKVKNLFSSKRLLGLHIDDEAYLCQLKQINGRHYLELLDASRSGIQTAAGHEIEIDTSALAVVLRDLKSLCRPKTDRINFSASGHSAIIKRISLPAMSEKELADSLSWEAEQYIPFDLTDVFLDAEIAMPDAGHGQMDVVMAAGKKQELVNLATAIAGGGFQPIIAEPVYKALQRVLCHNYNFEFGETVAVINVGFTELNIAAFTDRIMRFTSDIRMGEAGLLTEIQKDLKVTPDESRFFAEETEDLSSSEARDAVEKIKKEFSNAIAVEIQRSLDFFLATHPQAELHQIYLCGRGLKGLKHLSALLEKKMEIPVTILDPLRNIVVDNEKFNTALLEKLKPAMAAAVGLALRDPEDHRPTTGAVIPRKEEAEKTAARAKDGLKISGKDMRLMCRHLSFSIDQGLPLVQCLDLLIQFFAKNKKLAAALVRVKTLLEGDSSFAYALETEGFSPLFVTMVSAGEMGGILDSTLNRYDAFLSKKEKRRRWPNFFGYYSEKDRLIYFAEVFGMLLSSGVPILDAMEILTDNPVLASWRDKLIVAKDEMARGRSVASPLEFLPNDFVAVIRAGEATGALDIALTGYAKLLDE